MSVDSRVLIGAGGFAVVSLVALAWVFLGRGQPRTDTERSERSDRSAAPSSPAAAPTTSRAGAEHRMASTEPSPKSPSRSQSPRSREEVDRVRRQIREAWTARAPKPSSEAPAVPTRAVPPAVLGESNKDHIRSVVRDLVPVMQDCYNSELEEDEDFNARLVTHFTILGDEEIGGVVDEATVDFEQSEFSNDDADARARFSECISESMYTMEFDPPPGQTSMQVTYPFIFAPA